MRSARRSAAARVLEFLNERVERNYKPVDSNLDPIVARLKEGATEDECHMVIGRKALDWESDEKMNQFLRPATLFRKSKFWQYHGELGTNAGRVESA